VRIISIQNGDITASSYFYGAGTGNGYGDPGNWSIGATVTYNGLSLWLRGDITVLGSLYLGHDSVGTISIHSVIFNATSRTSRPGIGSGIAGHNGRACRSIHNGWFIASSLRGAGIGSGWVEESSGDFPMPLFVPLRFMVSFSLRRVWMVQESGLDRTFNASPNSSAAGGASTQAGVTNLSVLGKILYLNWVVGVGTADLDLLPHLTLRSPHLDCRSMGSPISLRSSSVVFENGSVTMITGALRMIDGTSDHPHPAGSDEALPIVRRVFKKIFVSPYQQAVMRIRGFTDDRRQVSEGKFRP
jgi:hypothetical protein